MCCVSLAKKTPWRVGYLGSKQGGENVVRDHTTRRGLANSESPALAVLSDGAVA